MAALHRPALPAPRVLGKRISGRPLLIAAGVVVIGAAALQVNQFSRATSTGYEIGQLERLRAEKQAENHELEAELARLSSLARVDWEARVRLGMQPADRRLHIEVNHAAPERQTLPTRYLPAADAAPAPEKKTHKPLWKRAADLLPF